MSLGAIEEAECGSCSKIIDANASSCPHCGASFEDEQMMGECGNCGKLISIDANSCEHCGAVFEDEAVAEEEGECGNCSAEIALDATSCPSCGAQFVEDEDEDEEEDDPPGAVELPDVKPMPPVEVELELEVEVQEQDTTTTTKPEKTAEPTTTAAVAVVHVNPAKLLIGGALALIGFIFLILIVWNAQAGFPFSSGNYVDEDGIVDEGNAKLNWLSLVGGKYAWSPLVFSPQDYVGLVIMIGIGVGGILLLRKELGKTHAPGEEEDVAPVTTTASSAPSPALVPSPTTTPVRVTPPVEPDVEMAECPACNKEIREDATECPHCGVEFADEEVAECPACNKEIPMEATSCPYCGVEFED